MSMMVADCPRCGAAHMTFDVTGQNSIEWAYGWQRRCEVFCVCRACHMSTVFVVGLTEISDEKFFAQPKVLINYGGAISDHVRIEGFINLRHRAPQRPPDHVPAGIGSASTRAPRASP